MSSHSSIVLIRRRRIVPMRLMSIQLMFPLALFALEMVNFNVSSMLPFRSFSRYLHRSLCRVRCRLTSLRRSIYAQSVRLQARTLSTFPIILERPSEILRLRQRTGIMPRGLNSEEITRTLEIWVTPKTASSEASSMVWRAASM